MRRYSILFVSVSIAASGQAFTPNAQSTTPNPDRPNALTNALRSLKKTFGQPQRLHSLLPSAKPPVIDKNFADPRALRNALRPNKGVKPLTATSNDSSICSIPLLETPVNPAIDKGIGRETPVKSHMPRYTGQPPCPPR